eukprot:scaffold15792_cov79-Skeletonema_dohrnii-CCMP3373.AAC.1
MSAARSSEDHHSQQWNCWTGRGKRYPPSELIRSTLIDRNFVNNKSTVPSSTYEDQQPAYPHFSTPTPSRRNGNVLTVSLTHNSMDVQINVQRNHHAGNQSGNNLLLTSDII